MHTFDLPDEKVMEIELDEWIAAGTSLQLSYPTDGLRMRGNSNFKFQYAIAGEYIKEHDPKRYAEIVAKLDPEQEGRESLEQLGGILAGAASASVQRRDRRTDP